MTMDDVIAACPQKQIQERDEMKRVSGQATKTRASQSSHPYCINELASPKVTARSASEQKRYLNHTRRDQTSIERPALVLRSAKYRRITRDNNRNPKLRPHALA